jgi:hypothetical protein
VVPAGDLDSCNLGSDVELSRLHPDGVTVAGDDLGLFLLSNPFTLLVTQSIMDEGITGKQI